MENFKQIVVPITLRGENYLLWARTAKTALCSRGLWSHIEGSKSKAPVESSKEGEVREGASSEEEKWFQENQVVVAAIQNSLETSLLEAYSHCETAKELWDTLKVVYGNVSNLTRVFEVKKAINTLSQEDMDFKKHYGKFSSLWAELEMLRPFTTDTKELYERREQDKVFSLLSTLSPVYNDLIKHILRGEKLPSAEEACSQIQKELGSSGLFGGKEDLPTANKATLPPSAEPDKVTAPEANKAFYKDMKCDHCKKEGHTKEKCWLLHPHLRPAWAPKNSSTTRFRHPARANHASSSRSESQAQKDAYIKREDLETIIQSIASKLSTGISYPSSYHSFQQNKHLIIDSGASHHMIKDSCLLNDITPALGNVVIANGDRVPIEGIGNLDLFDKQSRALYMPKFESNLLSVKKAIQDLKCNVIFGPNEVHFQDIESGQLLGKGGTKNELYVLEDTSPSHFKIAASNVACLPLPITAVALNVLWHARLGHPHTRALELMIPNVASFDNSRCEACILGKHCKTVFPQSKTIYDNCFDLVHSDVWTSPCLSRDNNKYFVTFIDEKSKYTWLTLLPSKDRVLDAFIRFQNYVTNQFNAKIKTLRTDNGGEYTSHLFKAHLGKYGIIHQTTCPYTPQQNGVAERKNRHLMEVARSMMFHTNVPKRFWGDAVMTSCYLINRIPTKILQDRSPFEVLTKAKPSLDHIRVFGCVCFPLIPGEQRNKLEAKSIRSMFIGYSTTQKGYKCLDPSHNRIYISRDVKFIETQGYYSEKDWDKLKDLSHSSNDRAASLRFLLDHLGNPPSPDVPDNATPSPQSPDAIPSGSSSHDTAHEHTFAHDPAGSSIHDDHEHTSSSDMDTNAQPTPQPMPQPTPPQQLRRSTRIRKDPANWINTRVYFNNKAVAHPIQSVCSLDLLPAEHKAFLGQIDSHEIPQSYEAANDLILPG